MYSTQILCVTRGLDWWLLPKAVVMGMCLAWFKTAPDMCPFCRQREVLAHVSL